jgi:fatty-acyl-CoA synthase
MRNQGLGSWPARRARMSPSRIALSHEGRHWTYAEFATRVNRLAAALRGLGVRRGDRVAYLGLNRPSTVETLFAAGAAGAVHLPLNWRLTEAELGFITADAGPRVLIAGPEHLEAARALGVPHVLGPEAYEELIAAAPDDPVDEPVTLDELAMIMYTSGTTGRPKGAMLTHGNLTFNTVNHLINLDLRGDEVALVTAPLFHIAALAQTVLPNITKGGRLIIMSTFDPERALETIESERVTSMFGVPAMFSFIAQSPRWASTDLSSLRLLECGGAPVPDPLIRTYQERGLTFLQGYGMTEAAPGVLYLAAEDSIRKAGTAGVPEFFTDVRVVTPEGADTAPGEPGEILVHGPNVMAGYWGRPEETAAVLSGDGWFRSGDIAIRDEEGFHRIVDRVKDMIISGGENIYPAEVESALLSHPGIADCAVIGVPDEKWGEVGKALVVPRPGADLDAASVLGHLDGRLARYKIPKLVELITEIPRTGSGKILKSRLRDEYGK